MSRNGWLYESPVMENTQDHLHKAFHDNRLLVKVPQVTAFFWIIKVLCTTVGETFADYLNSTLRFGLNGTTEVTVIALVIALFFQFRSKKYTPALYWIVVVLISIAGTLFTFALGTGVGDLIAERFSLGYGISFFIFAGTIAALALLWKFNIVNHVFAFWAVYVVTRPLGASIGDQMAQNDPKSGGWGLGTTKTSLIFLTAILTLVIFLSITKRDQIKIESSNP